jgi:hypothetical protein
MERLTHLENLVGLLRSLPFQVNLWEVQNAYYHVLREHYPDIREIANKGDEESSAWVRHFLPLGAAWASASITRQRRVHSSFFPSFMPSTITIL